MTIFYLPYFFYALCFVSLCLVVFFYPRHDAVWIDVRFLGFFYCLSIFSWFTTSRPPPRVLCIYQFISYFFFFFFWFYILFSQLARTSGERPFMFFSSFAIYYCYYSSSSCCYSYYHCCYICVFRVFSCVHKD